MRFVVTRTSHYSFDADDPVKPCEEATRAMVEYWDVRVFKSEKEYDLRFAKHMGAWRSEGTEHGVWSGGIRRRMSDEQVWVVDLADLDALMQFIDKYQRVVIYKPDRVQRGESALPRIEIYDTYRE